MIEHANSSPLDELHSTCFVLSSDALDCISTCLPCPFHSMHYSYAFYSSHTRDNAPFFRILSRRYLITFSSLYRCLPFPFIALANRCETLLRPPCTAPNYSSTAFNNNTPFRVLPTEQYKDNLQNETGLFVIQTGIGDKVSVLFIVSDRFRSLWFLMFSVLSWVAS